MALREHPKKPNPASISEEKITPLVDEGFGEGVRDDAPGADTAFEIDPDQELAARLRPGMSVEATVDTASKIDEEAVRRDEQAAAANAARDAAVPAVAGVASPAPKAQTAPDAAPAPPADPGDGNPRR